MVLDKRVDRIYARMHLNVEGMESEIGHLNYSSNLPKRKDLKEIKKKVEKWPKKVGFWPFFRKKVGRKK